MPSEQNEIRDDCFQPATTYRTLIRLLVLEGFLPNHTQNVNEIIASSSTRALVSNLPEGSRFAQRHLGTEEAIR